MTTELNKPVFRQTQTTVRDKSKRRLLIAGLLPGDVIELRPKGCRKAYHLTVEQAYHYAGRLEGERQRREKKAKKRGVNW